MEYCPFCANPLPKKVSVCPHCNKSLEIPYLKELYLTENSSHIDKQALRKIWYKEHRHIILPIVFLIVGMVIGAVGIYGFAQVQFRNERQNLKEQISALQEKIKQNQNAANSEKQAIEQQLQQKDAIIKILTEQKKLMGQVMAFTRRLAKNSTITPTSPAQIDYYQRNLRYLMKQFEKQQEELRKLKVDENLNPNLITVPQFFESN